MAGIFFERLKKYYSGRASVLLAEKDKASLSGHKGDIGTARENAYLKMLQESLPTMCDVYLGGQVFNENGDESSQIDIIVSVNKAIRYVFSDTSPAKAFTDVNSCIAAISIKSMLNKSSLHEALDNIASIPDTCDLNTRIAPFIQRSSSSETPFKMIVGFDGDSMETTLKNLREFYSDKSVPESKKPNLINIIKKYVIIRSLSDGAILIDGTKTSPNEFISCIDETGAYGIFFSLVKVFNF